MKTWAILASASIAWAIFVVVVVLAINGKRFAMGPEIGGSITLDLLQVLAFLVALSALLITATYWTRNKHTEIGARKEKLGRNYLVFIDYLVDLSHLIRTKRKAPDPVLDEQIDYLENIRGDVDKNQYERRPWGPLSWNISIYFIAWAFWLMVLTIFFAETDTCPSGPTQLTVNWLRGLLALFAWMLVFVVGTLLAMEYFRPSEITMDRMGWDADDVMSKAQSIKDYLAAIPTSD